MQGNKYREQTQRCERGRGEGGVAVVFCFSGGGAGGGKMVLIRIDSIEWLCVLID